jgi:hypothetical protein
VRRRDRAQRLRNVGRRHRPEYLRGEVQKLPPEWGLAGEPHELDDELAEEDDTSPLPETDAEEHALSERERIARAIARGGRDGE